MAYNILFKKGSYADFKTNILTGNNASAGALYFTEDEGGLYLGQSGGTVRRIQGVVQQFATFTDFQDTVTPPYATDVIYYIAEKSALIQWVPESGSGNDKVNAHWKVLNATAADLAAEVAAREALAERVTTAEGAIDGHTTAIGGIQESIGANTQAIAGHTDEISDIKETLSALTGGEDADGTIAGMIEAAVNAEAELREAADEALDGKISELTTELSGYKETVSSTYATKAELETHETTAASTYATKEELETHETTAASTYATQEALNTVSGVANDAAAAAQTNANAIDTLSSTVSSTYATKEELETHETTAASTYETIANVTAAKEELAQAISDEVSRAEGIESGLQTSINGIDSRVDTLETWFNAAADSNETIDNLTELLNYLEAHQGEATDMAGDIQANTTAIGVLEGYVGVPASGAGETAVAATGLHLAVDTVANNLASEITNRTNAVTNAINTCTQYTDAALTWGSFTSSAS